MEGKCQLLILIKFDRFKYSSKFEKNTWHVNLFYRQLSIVEEARPNLKVETPEFIPINISEIIKDAAFLQINEITIFQRQI